MLKIMYLNSQTRDQINLLLSIKFWILTLALVLIHATLIFAQNTVYIDPTNQSDPAEDGSIDHPFDSWSDISIASNTSYLQKRGTTYTMSGDGITINGDYDSILFGAYGTGDKPIINYTRQVGSASQVFYLKRTNHITIRDFEVTGTNWTGAPTRFVFLSGSAIPSHRVTNNTLISNCDISNFWVAIANLGYQTDVDSLTIDSCNIWNINQDGYFGGAKGLTIRNCHFWDINMNWHWVGHTQLQAGGDCIQVGGAATRWHIENNILDRRSTGNKFCLIINVSNPNARGVVTRNTFYPPKDTADDEGGRAVYHSLSGHAEYSYNKFLGTGYDSESQAVSIMYCSADTLVFVYNLIDSVSLLSLQSSVVQAYIYNNTFLHRGGASNYMIFNGISTGERIIKNNIFALNTGMQGIGGSGSGVTASNNIEKIGDSTNWGINPGFVDWQNQNYRIIENSPCANTGFNYSGYFIDMDSVSVPQQNCRDIGVYEFYDGGQTNNNPPEIDNQYFNINENAPNGKLVGIVIATDPDNAQKLTYSIISGNIDNAFQSNSSTGQLSVASSLALNYEANPVFNLTVQVQDNGQGNLTDQAIITIYLTDIKEVPIIDDKSFTIDENSSNGQQVGTVVATDPDNGQTLTYTITAGNTSGAFQIGSTSGVLSVSNSSVFHYETNPVFNLTVQVQDNEQGNLTDQACVTVNLTDVNEPPAISEQSFNVDVNSELIRFELNCSYSIFPNPANNYVNIGLDNLQGNKLIITIINVSGEIILKKEYKDFDGVLIDKFDIEQLCKGMYIVNITNGEVSKLDKFIKL